MLRIGDVAKQFNISNRTLRYWEEVGILSSSRMENGYRLYDDENAARIKQIVLLRKLKMPIAAIERIFMEHNFNTVRNSLINHLENLKQEAAEYNSLIEAAERILGGIEGSQSLEQVFIHLETQNEAQEKEHKNTSQIKLSERGFIMSAEQLSNVRIVKIPAMTIASFRAESASPEQDCAGVFSKFVLEYNLHRRSGYRFFGFNNPDPSEANPVYGYEMWVTIPDNFIVPEPLVKKHFNGGLYASISTQMNEIGERWKLLYNWCKNNDKYEVDYSFQWLEECSMDFETFISDQVKENDKQLDLMEPIKLK